MEFVRWQVGTPVRGWKVNSVCGVKRNEVADVETAPYIPIILVPTAVEDSQTKSQSTFLLGKLSLVFHLLLFNDL